MTIKNLLVEFAREGKIGILSLGKPKLDIELEFGLPIGSSRIKGNYETWKFHSLQISFHNGFVSFIGVYFDEPSFVLPSKLSLSKEDMSFVLAFQTVTNILKDHNISFTEYPPLTFSNQTCLSTKSGVQLYFIENNLVSMQISNSTMKNKNL